MLLYFILLFYWLILFRFAKDRKNHYTLFFAVLPLYLIMALKSVSVGSDTISYYNRYINASYMLTEDRAITEPGYNFVSYFFHDVLDVPFWFYNAIISAFICYILSLFLKYYSPNTYLSLFLYMTIGLFTMSMSGLRQTISISICTIPLIIAKAKQTKLEKSKIKRMILLLLGVAMVMLAYTFHNSALFFLPTLLLFNIRLSKRETIIICFIAIATLLFRSAIVTFMGDFVTERYEQYDINAGYAMNILMLLVPIAIGIFCVFVSRPDCADLKYSKELSIMFIFLALQITFNNLALSHSQIARLGYFFISSYVVLIPYALKSLAPRERSVATFVVILLCLVFFYMGTNNGTLRIDNYKFFWQEPMYLRN